MYIKGIYGLQISLDFLVIMDIRNFFGPSKKKTSTGSDASKDDSSKKKKKSSALSDSDDESPFPPSKRSRVIVSDSDDDSDLFPKKPPKKVKEEVKKKSKSAPEKSPKLKPTSAVDFFGKSQSKVKTSPKKEKSLDEDSDNDFEKTLQQLDKRRKSSDSKETKDVTASSDSAESSKKSEKLQNENSPPNKGLASKLASKAKEHNKDLDIKDNVKVKLEENTDDSSTISKYKIPKIKSASSKQHEDSESSSMKDKSKEHHVKKEKSDHKAKDSKTPTKSKSSSSKKKQDKRSYEIEVNKDSPKDKKKAKLDDSSSNGSFNDSTDNAAELLEKKKQHIISYKKYLSRAGPRNPGSKPIPEGAPNCLQGLTFVMTGVMESLDREEATDLIKKYGGRVTTSVSKNTSYLLLGDEPGESKVSKAEKLNTKTLDEDGLLEMIRKTATGISKSSDISSSNTSSPSISSSQKSSGSLYSSSTQSKSFSTPSPKRSSSQFSSPSSSSSPSSINSSQGTQLVSTQEIQKRDPETSMWVDKYKPATLKNIIGQQGAQSNANKLLNWLKKWNSNHDGTKKLTKPSPWAKNDDGAFFKAALLSGPPGVGKTTTAHLVCKDAGFDFIEMNASDTRSKKSLEQEVAELLSNTTLAGFAVGKKKDVPHALVMDEIDGMAGNEDRGGVQEMIALIKQSKVPIICMCNDRNHPKIRSLANYCFDLRFSKPRVEQIRGSMMSVCFKEGLKIKPDALDQIIIGSNQDVRQVLHHLSVWSANEKHLDSDEMKKEASKAKKDFKLGPWDVCRKVFTQSEQQSMSIHDKSGLFFHDYSIGPLFVQENYPKSVPHSAKGNRRKVLKALAETAQSLADGDLVERQIRSKQAWSLLPTQAVFSSVLPGEYMSGHLSGQIEFPSWLGNNSRRNKFNRLIQELQMHMRLKISGNKTDVAFDYSYPLRKRILAPLIKQGSEGVKESVEIMNAYDLLREDLDGLNEITSWSGQKDPMSSIESKVKAAFTRTFNKESHLSPYAAINVGKMKKSKASDDLLSEDTEEIEQEQSEDESIEADAMIKVKKKDTKKKNDTGKNSKASTSGNSKSKGKGKK